MIYYILVVSIAVTDETAMYEAYTKGNDPEVGMPTIHILSDKLQTVADYKSYDYSYNAVASSDLTANNDYYIEFGSVFGYPLSYRGVFKRSEVVPITFHANPEIVGEAYFDGDPSKTEKTIGVRKGAHLESYPNTSCGLETEQSAHLVHTGWSLSADAQQHDEEIIANEPIDIYAVYGRYKSVMLDANGGWFSSLGHDVTEQEYAYHEGKIFSPSYGLTIDEDSRMFSGWATTPDATEPDVIEGEVYDDLGQRLYAVYGEKVNVTFDANGGYFFIYPDMKRYEKSHGKGHVFEPVHVQHEDTNMTLMGWKDQDGVFIPYSSRTYPGYKYIKDTYLTAQWGRYIITDANGGCFQFDKDLTRLKLLFATYEPFSSNRIIELVGEPINFDDMKYLAGWATAADADTPDVLDGGTDVMGLRKIYAIWKDDSYYISKGKNQSWEKGSKKGLSVTAKRIGNDEMAGTCFRGIKIDGEQIFTPSFNRKDNLLTLTLTPKYLETLAVGKHTLRLEFTADAFLETTFTITKPGQPSKPDHESTTPEDLKNESAIQELSDKSKSSEHENCQIRSKKLCNGSAVDTGDHANIFSWAVMLALSFLGFTIIATPRIIGCEPKSSDTTHK